jgi:predicted nucleotidyltransferase
MRMKEEIREPMLKIASNFIEGLPFDVKIEDITLTGSLANYNWSSYSDVDLHIIVDFSKIDENYDLVKGFF